MGILCSCFSKTDVVKKEDKEDDFSPIKLLDEKRESPSEEKDRLSQFLNDQSPIISSSNTTKESNTKEEKPQTQEIEMLAVQQQQQKRSMRNSRVNRGTRPPSYKAIRGDQIDETIGRMMKKYRFVIPIIRISEGEYLIGTENRMVTMKGNSCMVKVDGGYEKLEEHITKMQDTEIEKLKKFVQESEKSYKEVIINLLQTNNADPTVISEFEAFASQLTPIEDL